MASAVTWPRSRPHWPAPSMRWLSRFQASLESDLLVRGGRTARHAEQPSVARYQRDIGLRIAAIDGDR